MQHTLKSILRVSIVLFLLMGLGLTLSAQAGSQAPGDQGAQVPDVDPDSGEFDRFVDALKTVQNVQQDVNEEIDQLIADSPLSEEDFGQIHRELQGQPDRDNGRSGSEISEMEREQYRDLMERIGSTQESSQEEMISAIEDNGLDVNRFNEIMMAARSDAELQEKLQRELNS
ncbi:MAG: DUF4168 domain-containing protein [Spirochaetia bacterium]